MGCYKANKSEKQINPKGWSGVRDDNFENVIFSDESTVALDKHGKLKTIRPAKEIKAQTKVSSRNPCLSCHFIPRGILMMPIDTVKFWNPLIREKFGRELHRHRFQQDNDPKHTSGFTINFFAKKIN